ncbi:MAG: alkaline phosphatase [Bacteroidota bacterium]|nr:MAG: alkaline phosphatase [Bacteroidota bacterium]
MKKIFNLSVLILFFGTLQAQMAAVSGTTEVRNIIILVGDGMGIAQVQAAMSVSKDKLNIERAQFTGFSKTYSADDYTTDSGAGATAIFTGKKTYNTAISVDINFNSLKSISQYAHEAGHVTGTVVSCDLVHATPAAFNTQNARRSNYGEIAQSYLLSNADVLIGGGSRLFDSLGLTAAFRKKGYMVEKSLEALNASTDRPVLVQPFEEHAPKMSEGRGSYLPDATRFALEKLNRHEKGFLLMIEGSQIDWGGHANDIDYVISELLDFDQCVGAAFDFADANPGTLVIVTADHETGGLTLIDFDDETKKLIYNFSTSNHTGVMVPVFAYGTGANNFTGIMENTDLFYKMMAAFGLQP